MTLVGKSILLIHPAWHSCGSHTVFRSQADAYRALGAKVLSLAVGTSFAQSASRAEFWSHYHAMTKDLSADERCHTGPSRSKLIRSLRWRRAIHLLHANWAEQMAGNAEISPVPDPILKTRTIDLVHCNHFYNMPLAVRISARFKSPIVLDTHDVQAHQIHLRGGKSFYFKKTATIDQLLKTELDYTRQADTILHLNSDEHEFFAAKIPERNHVLLYPSVPDYTPKRFFLIVASQNHANFLGVAWFLEKVLPLVGDIPIKIVGDIDAMVERLAPGIYQQHKAAFVGRVEDVSPYYACATAILAPIVAGHGLSIKAAEALVSGAPLIATPLAFRGISKVDATKLGKVWITEDPAEFASCIRDLNASAPPLPDGIKGDARAAIAELFSFSHYVRGLAEVASRLIAS